MSYKADVFVLMFFSVAHILHTAVHFLVDYGVVFVCKQNYVSVFFPPGASWFFPAAGLDAVSLKEVSLECLAPAC